MLKGKTIQHIQTELEQYGIRNNTVVSSLPTLTPKKIINTVSSYEPTLTPKKIINTSSSCEPTHSGIYYSKTISNNKSQEIIKKTNNIRYSVVELKSLFPGYANLYYTEIFDLLQETDFEINEVNLNTNLMKFINLGNNVQSQISKLNELLNFLPKQSFNQIKYQTKSKISFFSSTSDIKNTFEEFNSNVFSVYNTLYIEIQKIKKLDFSKYNLIFLYFGFFKFIADEIKSKQIVPDDIISSSVIASRVISLNNSISVLNQFKTLIQIEIQAKEIELNNLKDYLDVLKPSLSLLERQDIKKFKESFKDLLN